jgi:hypothetical protein
MASSSAAVASVAKLTSSSVRNETARWAPGSSVGSGPLPLLVLGGIV